MPRGQATAWCLLTLLAGHPLVAGEAAEARVSLDVKDAPVQDIVGLLAELGGFQVVFDRDVRCALTVTLHEAPWLTALDTTLRACGLGRDERGGVLWVASTTRLREETEDRRRLEEKRSPASSARLVLFKLSYARAEEMAPLLKRFVSRQGEVTLDPRTNTLVVAY